MTIKLKQNTRCGIIEQIFCLMDILLLLLGCVFRIQFYCYIHNIYKNHIQFNFKLLESVLRTKCMALNTNIVTILYYTTYLNTYTIQIMKRANIASKSLCCGNVAVSPWSWLLIQFARVRLLIINNISINSSNNKQ